MAVLYVEEFTASTTWTCPAGVHYADAEGEGGGGAGGGLPVSTITGCGGAAGGSYAFRGNIPVTPGQTYTVTVGATKVGTTGDGGAGNDTSFTGDNSIGMVAKGGQGGFQNGTAGTGSTSGCVGDLVRAGGNGAAGNGATGTASGGGGGGSGSSAAGAAASGQTGGVTTNLMGGAGGTGRTTTGVGGSAPTTTQNFGGGGAGALSTTSSTSRVGGNGQAGYLRLLYSDAAISGGSSIRQLVGQGGLIQ